MIHRASTLAIMQRNSLLSRLLLKRHNVLPQVVTATYTYHTMIREPEIFLFSAIWNDAKRTSSSNADLTASSTDDEKDFIKSEAPVKTKRRRHWEAMLGELIEYREKYGDTMVPAEFNLNPRLGTWVDTQRQNYKFHLQGKKSNLTVERIELLERQGMVWDVHDLNWETRFQELVQYKHKCGDLNPPQTDEHLVLWTWVFVQRRMYSLRSAGKPNSMSDKRIEALESIGFVFRVHEETWNQRFNELKQHIRDFGDCLVPKKFPQNPVLAKWVEMQRSQYKYLHDGRRSHLTPDRIKQLEEIGFVWNVHKYKWHLKMQELQDFSDMNGHCNVPPKGNRQLATWIRRQKSEYKKMMNGKKAQMDDERVALLRSAALELTM